MGRVYSEIDERLKRFIAAQEMFFVGSAPLSGDGLVNVSPKGCDSFRVLGPNRVGYLDLVGSGIETIAHLRENGRVVVMFCAFEGPPNIVRLHGTGRAVEPDDPEFAELAREFPGYPGQRAIIVVEVARISDSCGYGVPLYDYRGERSQMRDWAERKGEEGLRRYEVEENSTSLDGLPGLESARRRGSAREGQ